MGDVAYWISTNRELTDNLQKIRHLHSGVELFAHTGDTDVPFELLNE